MVCALRWLQIGYTQQHKICSYFSALGQSCLHNATAIERTGLEKHTLSQPLLQMNLDRSLSANLPPTRSLVLRTLQRNMTTNVWVLYFLHPVAAAYTSRPYIVPHNLNTGINFSAPLKSQKDESILFSLEGRPDTVTKREGWLAKTTATSSWRIELRFVGFFCVI